MYNLYQFPFNQTLSEILISYHIYNQICNHNILVNLWLSSNSRSYSFILLEATSHKNDYTQEETVFHSKVQAQGAGLDQLRARSKCLPGGVVFPNPAGNGKKLDLPTR